MSPQSLQTDSRKTADTVLSHYRSDNPGVRGNLYRLLNSGRLAGTGKLVILPVDQGFEHGPARSFAVNPGGYDPHYHAQLAVDAGCNAYAAPYGFIQSIAHDFAGKIPLILKVNNHDVLHDEADAVEARERCSLDPHALAGGRDSEELALLGPRHDPAIGVPIVIDQELDPLEVEIGKGRQQRRRARADAGAPA